jgi:phage tail sheath protein FI
MSQINESAIKTPGVYINEIPSFPPSIAQVATAIPAFIGYTQIAQDLKGKDLTNKPTRITSLLEYELYFGKGQLETNIEISYTQKTVGKATTNIISIAFKKDGDDNSIKSKHNMHSAVRFFYGNGGGTCYIISVGKFSADMDKDAGLDTNAFYNLGTGVGLEALAKEDEPTLIVFPEGQNMDANAYYNLQNQALAQCGLLQDRFCIMDIHDTGETLVTSSELKNAVDDFRNHVGLDDNKNYGAAYFPNLKTVYAYDYDESKTTIFHLIDDGVNPIHPGDLNDLTLTQISTPPSLTSPLSPSDSSFNLVAYNLFKQALNTQFPVVLPPSPAIAGIYVSVDAARGVWKAPANVGVLDVIGTTFQISDDLQEDMNIDPNSGKSVNAIRAFTGKGILVWGARTLDGNSNDFKYISVRRFYIMVEESAKKSAYIFAFEPNDGNTWVKVRAMIENYLTNLWRQGALAGSKPEQAFYVKIGLGQTMTFDDILNGRMIVEIGMAPVRPAEFIILRFSQIQQLA